MRHIGDLQKLKGKNTSSTWGQVLDFSKSSNEVQEVVEKGIRMKVGSGSNIRFWLDKWTGDDNLKNAFPRLFMISTQQSDFIEDMGSWDDGRWSWKFTWKRNLFVWEKELLESLYLAVDQTTLSESGRDVNHFMGDDDSQSRIGRLAWNKVAPSRAQLLVWFVLQGKLNTKDRLFRFRVPGVADDLCVFCKEERETINHIMFGCKYSSSLWYFCCNQWNLAFSLPEDPILCFLTWMDAPFYKFDKKLWTSLFYVISWSIWWIRKKLVFQNIEPNWDVEIRLILWRLGSWIKGWCPNFPFRPGEMCDELVKARRWSGSFQRFNTTCQMVQR